LFIKKAIQTSLQKFLKINSNLSLTKNSKKPISKHKKTPKLKKTPQTLPNTSLSAKSLDKLRPTPV
jgi:hypothetical protein